MPPRKPAATEAIRQTVAELERIEAELARRRTENRLAYYEPYPRQIEFHSVGLGHRERCFLAGNQLGKTWAGAYEVAFHLTGRYPEWWAGRRFAGPIRAWAAGNTAETTRDNPQRLLLGIAPDYGTGTIPKEAIVDTRMSRGMADAVDTVIVKHVSGRNSSLRFKYYEQGRAKWQGETLDLVWYDEEPPADVYSEGTTRLKPGGVEFLTATPLMGMTDVVGQFYPEPTTKDRALVQMTIDDVLHYSEEEKQRRINAYPPHEREARARGIPMLGSGRVYPVPESQIEEEAIAQIPKHWVRLAAIDFGWDHPTAVVWCAWDRDADVVHVYDCYRQREKEPFYHANVLTGRGKWIPVAWPHDGLRKDSRSAVPLRDQYRSLGVRMCEDHAQFYDGGYGREAGIMQMLDRMQLGKLKVAKHLSDWWEEFRQYHRKDGKLVEVRDDLMDATRYAIMMLRFAVTEPQDDDIRPNRYRRRRGGGVSSWMTA